MTSVAHRGERSLRWSRIPHHSPGPRLTLYPRRSIPTFQDLRGPVGRPVVNHNDLFVVRRTHDLPQYLLNRTDLIICRHDDGKRGELGVQRPCVTCPTVAPGDEVHRRRFACG